MEQEHESLLENDTWKLVDWLSNKSLFHTEWLFIEILQEILWDVRFDLSSKDMSKSKRMYYNETYSPIFRYSCILVVKYVLSAILHGELDKENDYRPPAEISGQGEDEKTKDCLWKSLHTTWNIVEDLGIRISMQNLIQCRVKQWDGYSSSFLVASAINKETVTIDYVDEVVQGFNMSGCKLVNTLL